MESFEIRITDLAGVHALYDARVEPRAPWKDHLAGTRYAFTDDGERPPVVSIHTTDGLFLVFIEAFWRATALCDRALWFPDVVPEAGEPLVVQARAFARGRQFPFIVMSDERTDRAVLELGTLSRRDDDPNLRGHSLVSMIFAREGFESRFLSAPDDDERVAIRYHFEFTPKNPRRGHKGRF